MSLKAKGNLTYEVIRSRRRTADIIVERNGNLVVRAPESIPDEHIEEIVESKRYWIYKALAEWRDLNATRLLREYRSGEGFLYLGRSYRLSLVTGQKETVCLKNGRFSLRRDLVDAGDVPAVQRGFRDYYIAKGKERIEQRAAYYAPKAGVEPSSVDVRDLGHRWASCSTKGKLAFHWKCMMAPLTIIDYIVVHELCHMHCRSHTEAFWNEVDKILPDYLERRDWLRRHGAGLDI